PSSSVTSLTRLPSTPPRMLRSSAASVAPSTRSFPRASCAPDSGARTPKETSPRVQTCAGAAGFLSPPQPASRTTSAPSRSLVVLPCNGLRVGGGQRERQGLAVRPGAQRVVVADVLAERDVDRVVGDRGRPR